MSEQASLPCECRGGPHGGYTCASCRGEDATKPTPSAAEILQQDLLAADGVTTPRLSETPDIEAVADVLRLHWIDIEDDDRGILCWCGDGSDWFETEEDYRAHVAQALAPVLAAAVREARAAELREFALRICDRNAEYGFTTEARHFGRTYAKLARDTADRIAVDAPKGGA